MCLTPLRDHGKKDSMIASNVKYKVYQMSRPSQRAPEQLRTVTIETNVSKYAEGSCLIKCGDTHVLCTATVEDKTPPWLKGKGQGWVTAEYGMLPRATNTRTDREAAKGGQNGRTQEIQRLIGRSLRSVVDLKALGEMQVRIDCDVIQADGGTRCASITGGYVALALAIKHLTRIGALTKNPLRDHVAAVSCGLYNGAPVLDLDYAEDSTAQADANFVMTGGEGLVEIQATAEQEAFTSSQFDALMALAKQGIARLVEIQKEAIGN
jgi:ribonuclease PH